MAQQTISIATLGCKTLTAVGSITGGTKSLVLVSNPGFLIGDKIIVAVGGEAGAGMRGTKGVGGNWPSVSYATTAALLAASPVEFTRAWAQDTGYVYFRGASSWSDLHADPQLYYTGTAVPLALAATITDVSGATLTLDTNANVTATSANVYFDNGAILTSAWGNYPDSPYFGVPNIKWRVPTGTYATSAVIQAFRQADWVIEGAGRTSSAFFTPNGTAPAYNIMNVKESARVLVRDLGFIGNAQDNGFGLIDQGATLQADFTRGLVFDDCTSCAAIRTKGTNLFMNAVGTQFGYDVWAYNCEAVLTIALQNYIQWQFQWAGAFGGGIVDCTIVSANLTGGFEVFASSGAVIIRPVGTNASMSSNGSDRFLFDAPNLTFEAASQYSDGSFSLNNPCININHNIQESGGGVIRNPRIIQSGRVDAINKTSLTGITLNDGCNDIKIIGTYPDGVSPKGYFEAPNWVSGSPLSSNSALSIRNSGTGNIVDGIRIVGASDTGDLRGNIHTEGGSIIVRNCVMDSPVTGTGTISETGTQTNAQWLATH